MEAYQYAAGGTVSYITSGCWLLNWVLRKVMDSKILAPRTVPAKVVAAAKYPLVIALQHSSYGYVGSDLFFSCSEKWDYNAF